MSRTTWWHDGRLRRRVLSALVLVVLVNAPVLSSAWREVRLERSGVAVTADVVAEEVRVVDGGERFLLGYRLGGRLDPAGLVRRAEVDAETYAAATAGGQLRVRVLPDRPETARAVGEVRRRTGLWVTLALDAVLLLAAASVWARRRRRPAVAAATGELAGVATSDVVVSDAEPEERRIAGGRMLLVGTLEAVSFGEARILLPDRPARVVLEGRAVLADPGDRVRVEVEPLG